MTNDLIAPKSQAAETALAFCREVMKVNTCDVGASKPLIVWDQGAFAYTDLNAVIAAVREWSAANLVSQQITCAPGGCYVAHILKIDGDGKAEVVSYACDDNLCQALMTACVEASRQLKGMV